MARYQQRCNDPLKPRCYSPLKLSAIMESGVPRSGARPLGSATALLLRSADRGVGSWVDRWVGRRVGRQVRRWLGG
jgi:hypothetical protein